MPSFIGNGAANKQVVNLYVGTASGNKLVNQAYLGTSGGNKLVHVALSVTASPDTLSDTTGTGTKSVGPSSVTVSGGIGPFTYAWSRVSGSTAISIDSPTSDSTRFTATVAATEVFSADFKCTVTDGATGFSSDSNLVAVTIGDI